MQSKVSLWQAYRFACIAILHNLPIFVPLFLLFALISVLLLALFYHVPALFSVVPTKSIFISNDQIDYATFLQENLGFRVTLTKYSILFLVLSTIIMQYFRFIITKLGTRLYHQQEISWHDVSANDGATFLSYLAIQLLFYILLIVKLLLFIIPGIYHLTQEYFVGIPFVENPSISIKEDRAAVRAVTWGHRLKILLFALANSILSSFLLTPLALLASIHLYHQLQSKQQQQVSTTITT